MTRVSDRQALAAARARVAAWVRERFGLPVDALVLADEVPGSVPGYPARLTTIVFWTGRLEQKHHFRIFRPIADVIPDDLPPYWMRDALAVPPGTGCDCC